MRPVSSLTSSRGGGAERLDQVVVRDGRLAVGGDRPLVVVLRVAADGGVDGAAGRVRVALDERVVALVDRALLELALQRRVRVLRLGDHHQAGGADVQAVHDALALGGAGGRDAVPGGGEAADHGRARPARGGVGGDADGLDDHDHVVVVVHDLHALDRLGHDLHRGGRLRHLHLEPGAPADPLGLSDHRPVDRDLPAAASSAALVREKPNMREMAASTRSPSRPSGTGRVRISGIVLTRRVCRTGASLPHASDGALSPCGRCRPGRDPGRTAARSGCRRTRWPSRPG